MTKQAIQRQIDALTAKRPSLGLEASNATSSLIVALSALADAPAKANDLHKKMVLDRMNKLTDAFSRSQR